MARVLLVVENNAYPFDVRVRREASALRDAGHQVTVLGPRQGDQRLHERLDGIEVYRFPFPVQGNGLLGYAAEFGYATAALLALSLWVLLRRGCDVVHVANPPDTLFVIGLVFKCMGKRFVFDQHDLAPETYLSRFGKAAPDFTYRVLRWLEGWSFRLADIVIATNESYRAVALRRGGKRPSQVFVVRNGPPLSFGPTVIDRELAGKARFVIGYIGTMGPQDGVDFWLRAIHELVFTLQRRDFHAVIIGSGDALPGLRALAAELQVEPFVWFTGRIPDVEARSYLTTSHICVHPDPFNQLNDRSTMNKMMEYMALGKPVVSFDLTEARFSAQDAATYAKPNDVLDFAQRVAWLMDHAEDRERLGEFGRKRFAAALAWEYSVPQLLRAYAALGH